MRNGIVVIEGLDGSGKTTLRRAIFRLYLEKHGCTPLALVTANYLDPAVADSLAQGKYRVGSISNLQYLRAVVADKVATENVLLARCRGRRPVIADRWLLSDMVFLSVKYDFPFEESYTRFAAELSIGADVTLLLSSPAALSMARARQRGSHTVRGDWDVNDVQQAAEALYAGLIQGVAQYPLLGEAIALDATKSKADLLHDAYLALAQRDLI